MLWDGRSIWIVLRTFIIIYNVLRSKFTSVFICKIEKEEASDNDSRGCN